MAAERDFPAYGPGEEQAEDGLGTGTETEVSGTGGFAPSHKAGGKLGQFGPLQPNDDVGGRI